MTNVSACEVVVAVNGSCVTYSEWVALYIMLYSTLPLAKSKSWNTYAAARLVTTRQEQRG